MAPKKQKPAKSTVAKAPPVDKLLIPAIGIALAFVVYQFVRGIQNEVVRVNMDDELELREIFFGESIDGAPKNFAVLCHPDDAIFPISSVFQDASMDGNAPAEFRVMDCNHKLSNDKTVYERFQLKEKQRPTIFVSGAVGEPKQVPPKHLKTGSMLVKALKNLLEPKVEKIETTQDLRSKCLEKDLCGLLLKGSKQSPKYVKDAMAKLVVEYPTITFAAVDAHVLYVKGLEAEYLPEMVPGEPRFAMFQKVSGSSSSSSKERLKTSVAALEGGGGGGGLSYGTLSQFLGNIQQRRVEMTKVSALPTIKTRTKKLEEEERAKRHRRTEQRQRQQDGGSSSGSSSTSSSGGSTENDGSREGRRAERERRRAEHRANNPNYREKTPEEIAEMERKRRERMEEEAAKWNMDGEAPEEGGDAGGAGGDYYMEDYEEWVEDDVEEEDEDVLDLD
eukprot:Nitzschia sp. Nitz4//scaffold23_size168460//92352//93953//NITZ4_002224-RA/size168460-snap-gene-0.163-mRNA-1//-1//CDS//3329543650//6792//frame0